MAMGMREDRCSPSLKQSGSWLVWASRTQESGPIVHQLQLKADPNCQPSARRTIGPVPKAGPESRRLASPQSTFSVNLELPNIPGQPCMGSALLFFCHSKKRRLDVVRLHKTAARIPQHREQATCGALIVPASSSTSAARSSLPSGGGS